MSNKLEDRDWIRAAFVLPKNSLNAADRKNDLFRGVRFKYTDTSLGGNFAMNPPPQFTETADLTVKGMFTGSDGMGRYYSESIDDNSHIIHMGFGVPEFRSLVQLFNNSYNLEAGMIANKGRGGGIFYNLGKAAGFAFTIPFQPLILAGKAIRYVTGNTSSKYYSLKPTMPLYWNAVNTMANTIAVNMGIVPLIFSDTDNEEVSELSKDISYSSSDISNYRNALRGLHPDLYRENGTIDVYAVANRAQRLNQVYHEKLEDYLGDDSASSYDGARAAVKKFEEGVKLQKPNRRNPYLTDVDENKSYLTQWLSSSASKLSVSEQNALNEANAKELGKEDEGILDKVGNFFSSSETEDAVGGVESGGSWYSSITKFAEAEIRDGSRFVSFRVDGKDSVSESFTNNTKESDLGQTLNSISGQGRTSKFNFAGGNIGDGLIANAVEGVTGAVGDFIAGTIDGFGMGGLIALTGSSFFDFPKQWDSSTANFPTSSYKIELRSPYGNKISRYQNLYIPLAMLLASALPISTGHGTYTSPFLVELYSRGRNQIRLGLIESMEITRGVGNLAWTPQGESLGIDISFTVADLSSIMHMPLAGTESVFSEDSAFSDYMATLGNLSLTDQVYKSNKMRLNATRMAVAVDAWASPSRFGSWLGSTRPAQLLSAIARVADRDIKVTGT